MNRVRIFACAGAGLALAALGWCLPEAVGSAALISRSAGLAVFGIAMVAAGLVFRSAVQASKELTAPQTRPEAREFRAGFERRRQAMAKQAMPRQNEVVVALRRAVAEQAQKPPPAPAVMSLPADEIERLQDMLHSRAAALRTRNAAQAERRFMRSGVDIHGLVRG